MMATRNTEPTNEHAWHVAKSMCTFFVVVVAVVVVVVIDLGKPRVKYTHIFRLIESGTLKRWRLCVRLCGCGENVMQ